MEQDLYTWQKECLTAWETNEYRGIAQAVTGSGKTRMAIAAIRLLKKLHGDNLRVKIVVPGNSLLTQWKRALLDNTDIIESPSNIGGHGGGYHTANERNYMIYVINSARYRLARQILQELNQGHVVFLIADECHHYTGNENQKIFDFLPFIETYSGKYCSLGLSATIDDTTDNQILIHALGKIFYQYNLTHALKNKTICDFSIWQIAVSFKQKELQEYEEITEIMKHTRTKLLHSCPELKHYHHSGFFSILRELATHKEQQVSTLAKKYLQLSYCRKRIVYMADSRISCVCQLLNFLDKEKQIIVFGESIAQIEELYKRLYPVYSSRMGRYHSKRGSLANKNTLERFRTGDLKILFTCHTLDEGIDIPNVTVGIILSGTSMERQRLQRLGRLLRKNDKKRMACLYYLFVADAKEERAYFPKAQEHFHTEDLFYDNETEQFSFPSYENAANKVLSHMAKRNSADNLFQETLKCLQEGFLREDWLLSTTECTENARKATNTHERNYWLCMKQMTSFKE